MVSVQGHVSGMGPRGAARLDRGGTGRPVGSSETGGPESACSTAQT